MQSITVSMIKAKIEWINGWLERGGRDWRIAVDTRTGGRIVGLQMVYANNTDRVIRDLRYGDKAELSAYLCGMMDVIRD